MRMYRRSHFFAVDNFSTIIFTHHAPNACAKPIFIGAHQAAYNANKDHLHAWVGEGCNLLNYYNSI